MFFIKYFILPFFLPVFFLFYSCWKNPALIRDSVVASVITILLYACTFVPGLAAIFDRMTRWSHEGRWLADRGEAVSGSCSVKLMRLGLLIAIYVFAYMAFTGKFVPAG
ncbi:MAG: hypothetical protein ACQETH_13535 [Candidatus Rifleibacteriota bacterium]